MNSHSSGKVRLLGHFEEGKMDIAILLLLYEIRMVLKIILLWMLKNEISTRMQDAARKNLVWNCCKILKSIRRIREYDIELLMTDLKELKHVVSDHCQVLHTELGSLRLDEVRVQRKHLHTINHGSAA